MCTLNKDIVSIILQENGSEELSYYLLDTNRDYENNFNYHLKIDLDYKEEVDNQSVIN